MRSITKTLGIFCLFAISIDQVDGSLVGSSRLKLEIGRLRILNCDQLGYRLNRELHNLGFGIRTNSSRCFRGDLHTSRLLSVRRARIKQGFPCRYQFLG